MQCPNSPEHEMEVVDAPQRSGADTYAWCLDCGATVTNEGEWLECN